MGKQGKLGADFWANFYRLDIDTYTEKAFRDEVATLGIQTKLQEGDSTITLKELQDNMVKVKEHMRKKGFRAPCASDKDVICVWDLVKRSCNSTHLQTYIVSKCEVVPHNIKSKYLSNVQNSSEAAKRMGNESKRNIDALADKFANGCVGGGEGSVTKKPRGVGSGPDVSYSVRRGRLLQLHVSYMSVTRDVIGRV